MKIELNENDSRILALQVEAIKETLQVIDWEYLEAFIEAQSRQAEMYQAAAVLNAFYSIDQGNLLNEQLKALKSLVLLKNALVMCDEYRTAAQLEMQTRQRLSVALGGQLF